VVKTGKSWAEIVAVVGWKTELELGSKMLGFRSSWLGRTEGGG